MQAIKPLASRTFSLFKPTQRSFSVTWSELHQIDAKVRRKVNKMKMYTEQSEFTYEPPKMSYDKSTGDVTIIPKTIRKKPTIIQSNDDMERERQALYKEMGIEDGNIENLDVTGDVEAAAEKIYQAKKKMDDDWDIKFN